VDAADLEEKSEAPGMKASPRIQPVASHFDDGRVRLCSRGAEVEPVTPQADG
jgi:hypothetical protein